MFALLTTSLYLASIVNAYTYDCTHLRIDDKKFNFEKIGGPHSVLISDEEQTPAIVNTTWTVDICRNLKIDSNVPKADQCPNYTRVCGVSKSWNPAEDPDQEHVQTVKVIPVAGPFDVGGGASMDPHITRLKATDSKTEGLQIELNGGRWDGRKQKAVISFQCDEKRTGNEGNESEGEGVVVMAKDDSQEEDTNSLTFVSYGAVESKSETVDVLRLNWRTKYACEDYQEDDGDTKNPKVSTGWGFFTWFILILFLGIAAYLIFGSWLNYNRYGARGWDLLPHGDTIRDVPYLVKDFSRKVVETVSGGGSRGGYSAV